MEGAFGPKQLLQEAGDTVPTPRCSAYPTLREYLQDGTQLWGFLRNPPQELDAMPGPSPPFATMKGRPEDLQEERTWWLDGAAAVASWARAGCPLSTVHSAAEMLPLVPWH